MPFPISFTFTFPSTKDRIQNLDFLFFKYDFSDDLGAFHDFFLISNFEIFIFLIKNMNVFHVSFEIFWTFYVQIESV